MKKGHLEGEATLLRVPSSKVHSRKLQNSPENQCGGGCSCELEIFWSLKRSKMVWSVLLLLEETKHVFSAFFLPVVTDLLMRFNLNMCVFQKIYIYIYVCVLSRCAVRYTKMMYIYKFLAPWDAPNNKRASHWSWSSTTWHSTKTCSMYTHLVAD